VEVVTVCADALDAAAAKSGDLMSIAQMKLVLLLLFLSSCAGEDWHPFPPDGCQPGMTYPSVFGGRLACPN
jgi:hypothetical protein